MKNYTMQLKLFDIREQMFEVSYWSYPYDKKGNLMPWVCKNWIEIVDKKKLLFFQEYFFKYSCEYFNVKIKEL